VAFANWVVRALEAPGLDATKRLQVHALMHNFVQGLAMNVEEEARAHGETGLSEEDWMRSEEPKFIELATRGGYEAFGRVMKDATEFDLDFDVLFELGLKLFLDGIGALARRS
jgi:hypothetical protein